MSLHYKTRPYQKGDEKGVFDLLKLTFTEWRQRENIEDYWRWKYIDCPLGSIIAVAVANDQIIGVGHELALNVKVGKRVYKSQYGDDFATHPDYRGMGVYKSLVNTINAKKIEFDFNLSTNPIVIESSKRSERTTQFQFPYSLTHLFRINDIGKHVKAKQIDNKAFAVSGLNFYKSFNQFKQTISKTSKDSEEFTFSEISEFSENYEELWETIRSRYNFIIEKNTRFMKWRYTDPRSGKYFIREVRKSGELAGYTVLQIRTENNYSEGYLVDIESLSEAPEAYDRLVKDACDFFDGRGLNAAHLQFVKGHPLQESAGRYGFFEPPGTSKIYISCNLIEGYEEDRRLLEKSRPRQLHFGYGTYF